MGRLCHHETDGTSLPGRMAACSSPAHADSFRLHGGIHNEVAWQHPPWNTPLFLESNLARKDSRH